MGNPQQVASILHSSPQPQLSVEHEAVTHAAATVKAAWQSSH